MNNSKTTLKNVTNMEISHDKKSVASSSRGVEIPDVFLYTTLNQNQTKDLRKAGSNTGERRCLANIFNLNVFKGEGVTVNKVD